jgi:tetratricopeptide (TPR) repeat protein
MKRSERHRLKENELSTALSGASARVAENKRTFGIVVAVVLLVGVAAGGYWAWKTRTETRALALLTEATLIAQQPVEEPKSVNGAKPAAAPGSYPTIRARSEAALAKFNEVLNSYPSTRAGVAARYHAASALMLLGRPAEAVTRYQEVVQRAGTRDFYGRMAQLGVIEAQVQAKQFDQAIAGAEALANDTSDETLPRDALLMELGRVYAAAGKKAEASKTFSKVVTDFPQSPYVEEAKQLASAS